MLKRFAVVAAGLAIVTNAHMFISSPPPIEGSAPKSPLDASGDNFPCHGVALPTSGGQSMAAGSSQVLAWDTGNGANTAVHGGGSCQISITYETDPAKVRDPKNWYVIYSIESGCPSNTHQNLDGTYQGPQGTYTGSYPCTDPRTNGVDCVNQFNFTIPQGVKSGHAILAWTWFNSVGNREMYMNCVNTQLTGGDGSEMDDLPSMFVGNMASVDQCPTTQSVDLRFPFPGKYVTTKTPTGNAASTAFTFPLSTPSGFGCASDGAPIGSAAAIALAIPASSTTSPVNSQTPAIALVTVTTFATVTGSAITTNAPSQATSKSVAISSISSSGSTGGGSASTVCPAGTVACSSPGSILCIGSDRWGECDINHCAIPMAVAAGTSCSNGAIVKRHMQYGH